MSTQPWAQALGAAPRAHPITVTAAAAADTILDWYVMARHCRQGEARGQ
jgi:hypothetical protein